MQTPHLAETKEGSYGRDTVESVINAAKDVSVIRHAPIREGGVHQAPSSKTRTGKRDEGRRREMRSAEDKRKARVARAGERKKGRLALFYQRASGRQHGRVDPLKRSTTAFENL